MSLVIFDCDGVLVDSEEIFISAELDFLSKAGMEFERDDYVRRFMGMPLDIWEKQIHEDYAKHLGRKLDPDCFENFRQFTAKKLKEDLVAIDGAHTIIRQLDVAICVASSSSPGGLEWKLEHTGLLDLFQPDLFSTHLVENGKPAPDLFLFAADKMNKQPSSCVVVEDSSNGVLAAKRAGMKVVGFTAGSHCPANHGGVLRADGADTIVNSFEELPAVLVDLL